MTESGRNMEIKDCDIDGYSPLFSYNGWRVAVANACDRLKKENLYRLERHLNTDEVFILLKGSATLHIGKEMSEYHLEIGKFYNVKRGEWHCISMEEGAKVAIIENDDTNDDNSEKYFFKEK